MRLRRKYYVGSGLNLFVITDRPVIETKEVVFIFCVEPVEMGNETASNRITSRYSLTVGATLLEKFKRSKTTAMKISK
jgi:hypothetical protein